MKAPPRHIEISLALTVALGLFVASMARGQVSVLQRQLRAYGKVENMDLQIGGYRSADQDIRLDTGACFVYPFVDSLVQTGQLSYATALQDVLGFSALTAGFTDDSRTFSEKVTAKTEYMLAVTNYSSASIPARMHMQLTPGRLLIRDETELGLRYASGSGANLNFPRTKVLFSLTAQSAVGASTVWQWQYELAGGRAGVSNIVYTLDPNHLGTPQVTRYTLWDGALIEDNWDAFSAAVDFGDLPPHQALTIQYNITVEIVGTDNFAAGPGITGARVEAGDPFELTTGDPKAVGTGLALRAGDKFFGMLKPLKISGFARTADGVRFSFNAEPERPYTVEFRDSLAEGDWSVLTNIPPQALSSTLSVSNTTKQSGCFYRLKSP